MERIPKRKRYYSEHIHYNDFHYVKTQEVECPDTPLIEELELDMDEELELDDLEIEPSEEFLSYQQELKIQESST